MLTHTHMLTPCTASYHAQCVGCAEQSSAFGRGTEGASVPHTPIARRWHTQVRVGSGLGLELRLGLGLGLAKGLKGLLSSTHPLRVAIMLRSMCVCMYVCMYVCVLGRIRVSKSSLNIGVPPTDPCPNPNPNPNPNPWQKKVPAASRVFTWPTTDWAMSHSSVNSPACTRAWLPPSFTSHRLAPYECVVYMCMGVWVYGCPQHTYTPPKAYFRTLSILIYPLTLTHIHPP